MAIFENCAITINLSRPSTRGIFGLQEIQRLRRSAETIVVRFGLLNRALGRSRYFLNIEE